MQTLNNFALMLSFSLIFAFSVAGPGAPEKHTPVEKTEPAPEPEPEPQPEPEVARVDAVDARAAASREVPRTAWTLQFVSAWESGPILPEDIEPTRADMRLALALAKLCVNEAGLSHVSPEDCAMLWQVIEGHGDTTEERLRWVRRHSRCVTGRERPSEARRSVGNCRWTRNLKWASDEPAGWPENWPGFDYYSGRWDQVRRLAIRLVLGVETMRPCEETPDTWGGRMDRPRALRLGFNPIRCQGTRNDGYTY